MMTRQETNQYLCAILATLNEVPFATETSLYLALNMDMDKLQTIKSIMMAGNLAYFRTDYTVWITPAGREMAAKIAAFNASKT